MDDGRPVEIGNVFPQIEDSPPELEGPGDIEWVGNPEKKGQDNLDVFFSKKALNEALADGRKRGSKNETGGVLLGKHFINSKNGALSTAVTNYVPVDGRPSVARFGFTPDDWTKANREADQREVRVVGWYHTHPNYGIFLSGNYDQDICDNHFAQPGQIALVFDPIENQIGLFSRNGTATDANGQLRQYGSYKLHNGYYLYENEPIDIKTEEEQPETQIELEEKPRKRQLLESVFLVKVFVGAQLEKDGALSSVSDEEVDSLESALEQNDLTSNVVLDYVQEKLTEEIDQLSTITDPDEQRINFERAEQIRNYANAYKFLREAEPQELESIMKKINT